MAKNRQRITWAAVIMVAACEPGTQPLAPDVDATFSTVAAEPQSGGAVYLTSNDAAGNTLLIFDRDADGRLTFTGTTPTGGLGTSAGLGNQLSMVLTGDQRRLFVVNAGSDDITGFDLTRGTPEIIGQPVPSGGDQPISLTVHDDLLYVLNAGNGGSISGFRIAPDGSLTAISGSTRSLASAGSAPAQIEFTPDGGVLVVTEKGTNTLETFVVADDGQTGDSHARASAGQTPFGFAFDQRGDLVVSEANGNGTSATASSYRVGFDGVLTLVSGAVVTTQTAACWVAIGQNGRNAYTTNTGSGTVSRLAIGTGATLSLVDAVAGVTGPGSLPQDAAFSPGGRFLYVRNAAGSVSGFRVENDGALSPVGDFGPIPPFANGIVVR